MIKPEQIPKEVVEAAARALAADANLHWDDIPYGHTILRNEALAALRAGLNAWPEMEEHITWPEEKLTHIILPIPQDAGDE